MRTYLYYIIRLTSKTVRADETTAHKQYGPEALYTHTRFIARNQFPVNITITIMSKSSSSFLNLTHTH